MLKKYAVMGNPIAHSKSPQIHLAFAKQFDIDLSYERILVPLGGLENSLKEFQSMGGKGTNITLPFKEDAWRLMQERTPRAQIAGAVNTIVFLENGRWQGDNTDGIGLLRDLKQNHKVILYGKRLLIIGAGGSTKGIIEPLLQEDPQCLVIANRTLEKAQKLVQEFKRKMIKGAENIASCGFAELEDKTFDLVINTTSASTKGESLKLPEGLVQGAVCYDLAYGDNAKPFLAWAKANHAVLCLDGLGMLVEQAAESFFIWHSKRPDTHAVIKMLS